MIRIAPDDRVVDRDSVQTVVVPVRPFMTLVQPHDIASAVLSIWRRREPRHSTERGGTPSHEVIEHLVSVAFEVSLLQEEGRPAVLRLLLHPPEKLDATTGPPNGLQRLVFTEPRPFTAQELRRLSPAASYHRSLIGVALDAADQPRVWGILQSGPRWLHNIQGGRGSETPLPDSLVIAVTGPGCFDIYRGHKLLLTVRAGQVAPANLDVFQAQWLRHAFAPIRQEIFDLHYLAHDSQSESWAALDESISRYIAQHMVKRLITTVRNSRHGGTLIVVPAERCEEFAAADSNLKLKYRFHDDPARQRFQHLIVSIMNTLAALGGRGAVAAESLVGWEHYNEIHDESLTALDEGIFEMSHLIAQLAGVDGAVALSKRLDLLGFGAEIIGAAGSSHGAPSARSGRRSLPRGIHRRCRHSPSLRIPALHAPCAMRW